MKTSPGRVAVNPNSAVRQLRYSANMTQAQAAALLDVSVGAWRGWEQGVTPMHRRHVASFKLLSRLRQNTGA